MRYIYLPGFRLWLYCSLAREHPWAMHLTCLLNRGVSALLGVSAFNPERAPTFVYVTANVSASRQSPPSTSISLEYCHLARHAHSEVQGYHCSPCRLHCHQALDEVPCARLRLRDTVCSLNIHNVQVTFVPPCRN